LTDRPAGKVKRAALRREAVGDADLTVGPRAQTPAVNLGHLPRLTGYLLRRAQLAVFQDFLRSYAELDIRPGQYAVLTVIEQNPGLKQSQVSVALDIKRANLVALLDSLESRGLAKRVPVASDRRSYALFLTEAGTRLMEKLREINDAHERRVTARIGPGGQAQLLKLLDEVISAVGTPPGDDDA
jgi:DNA-binding MarR family transcriptional regulator